MKKEDIGAVKEDIFMEATKSLLISLAGMKNKKGRDHDKPKEEKMTKKIEMMDEGK